MDASTQTDLHFHNLSVADKMKWLVILRVKQFLLLMVSDYQAA